MGTNAYRRAPRSRNGVSYDICKSNGRPSPHAREDVLNSLLRYRHALVCELTTNIYVPSQGKKARGTHGTDNWKHHQAEFGQEVLQEVVGEGDAVIYTALGRGTTKGKTNGFDVALTTRYLDERRIGAIANTILSKGKFRAIALTGWPSGAYDSLRVMKELVQRGYFSWGGLLKQGWRVRDGLQGALNQQGIDASAERVLRDARIIQPTIFASYVARVVGKYLREVSNGFDTFDQVPTVREHRSPNKSDEHSDIDLLIVAGHNDLVTMLSAIDEDENGIDVLVKNPQLNQLRSV